MYSEGYHCPTCIFIHIYMYKLQLVNVLYWISGDILPGRDEFSLANESPPIRTSRDTHN